MDGYTPEEIEAAGLDDFRVFLRQVWDFLELPEPTPVQNDIAYTLQHGPRRLVVEAFRGVGKSWITVAFVLWVLFLDPQKKIMVVSANETAATDFTTFAKRLIEGMPLLQHLKPRTGQRDSNLAFDVGPARPDKSPSVKSVGITGQLTGSRADVIVPDDIETPKNSYTHVLRERNGELIKEFDSVLKPGGRIVYLGTPQVEQSVYERLPARGYTIRIWPSEIPARTEQYRGRLAPYIVRLVESGAQPGDPTDPARFGRSDLDERRLSYGTSGYALQFMLDVSPSEQDKHPLKLSDLIVQNVDNEMGYVRVVHGKDKDALLDDLASGGFDGDVYYGPVWKSSEMAPFTETIMFVDPSGRGTDETAYAIVRLLYSQLYLVDVGGYRDGFAEETLQAIAAKAARYRVGTIIVEPNYGGGMFGALLRPHVLKVGKSRIEDSEWSRGQKELRILDVLEPVVQAHRLTVDRRVIERDLEVQQDSPQYSFVHQFTRMERTRGALSHEDRLEAVAGAVQYFTERMSRDQQKAHESHKEKMLDEELRNFRNHVFNIGEPTNPRFA